MRTVLVMFDTLAKNYLEPFGNMQVQTPNFTRLAEKAITFDNYYAGSLPCIPARRELQTGKYNFLHRSWGPLEPFDFSVFEELKKHNIYTHLCTDHSHYFEDGGATYHNRFSTWEGFRGQEGDRWSPHDLSVEIEKRNPMSKEGISVKQHYHNIKRMATENEMSLTKTIDAGLAFLESHQKTDDWFLQIECFDPHEPFYVPQKYRDLYDFHDKETMFNWPKYMPIEAEKHIEELDDLKANYAALITMCDAHLGRILDFMDEHNLWEDTALIVNTDHGFLLGEHNWMGKNIPPAYNEVVQIPLFIWHPELKQSGSRRQSLSQSIDLVPTILDFYGIEIPECVDGKSLMPVLKNDEKIHDYILFGVHGGAVNITDGHYVYMRENVNNDVPIVQYTLMPTLMRGFIPSKIIDQGEFIDGGKYTNGHKCLNIPLNIPITGSSDKKSVHRLYDLATDPSQEKSIQDAEVEARFIRELKACMELYDAPQEEFERIGL